MSKVTINDICREAKVSLTTVSRVLNDQPGVGDDTRKRVQQIMKRMKFTPNAAARHLSQRRTETIGVIFPKFDTGFFSQFLQGVERVAQKGNYYILTVTSPQTSDSPGAALKLINEQRVDGLILFDPTLSTKQAAELSKQSIPVVAVDQHSKNMKLDSLAIDDYTGAFLATEHLIEHGYTRIATLTGPSDWVDSRERLRGYKAALEKHGIAIDDRLIVEGNFQREPSTWDFIKHFQNGVWPEAIFAANDEMALGLLKYTSSHRDPAVQRTGIIGFDDIDLSAYVGLTTVHSAVGEMGKRSATLLLELIQNKETRNLAPQHEAITPRLSIRSSCGCLTSPNKPQSGVGKLLQA